MLHLRDLPSFGGRLRASDTEVLIQLLTVPYLRVPIILSFFSKPRLLVALDSKDLQEIVDACLFEPGLWKSDMTPPNVEEPRVVPAATRAPMATSCGLIFNELQKSPNTIMKAIESLLGTVLELDTGQYTASMSRVILFVIRIVVRVESYALHMLQRNQSEGSQQDEHSWANQVQGTRCELHVVTVLQDSVLRIRSLLNTAVVPMLEAWYNRCVKKQQKLECCILHAHIAFIFKNVTADQLDFTSVSALLCSQVFLHHNYMTDYEVSDDREVNRTDEETQIDGLGIPLTELFDIFTAHRVKLISWLHFDSDGRNDVMEAVLRVVTTLGRRDKTDSKVVKRKWTALEGSRSGCFVPDTETDSSNSQAPPAAEGVSPYEAWFRKVCTLNAETEVNVQLGELTLQKQHMQLLHSAVQKMQDYREVFGESDDKTAVQSAPVQITVNRQWHRLLGRSYDVQLWAFDNRGKFDLGEYNRPYPKKLFKQEKWIKEVLKPWMDGSTVLSSLTIYLPVEDCSGFDNVTLTAHNTLDESAENPQEQLVVKEIVIIRHANTVHLYNIVEHGRRFYRTIIWSSNSDFCLQDMTRTIVSQRSGPAFVSGNSDARNLPSSSLVILRTLSSEIGTQTFVPNRFLKGILPEGLITDFQFWQNADDSLTGYMSPPAERRTMSPYILQIALAKQKATDKTGYCNSLAGGVVRRVPIKYRQHKNSAVGDGIEAADNNVLNQEPDPSKSVLTMLNLMYALPDSLLMQLTELMVRLDSLSHVLAWTDSDAKSKDMNVSAQGTFKIHSIELPRVGLSFTSVTDGQDTKLCSDQFAGLFISNTRTPTVLGLMEGIPHSILLEDNHEELYLLVPATVLPLRPSTDSEHAIHFPSTVLLNRNDEAWRKRLGSVKHYLYRVHLSQTFMICPSLGSRLYLLLLRFFNRQYKEVFTLADGCFTDVRMTNEQRQIFNQLKYTVDDTQADAVACRLKIGLVLTANTHIRCPWDQNSEMREYIEKHKYVSFECKLSIVDEITLLKQCSGKSIEMSNRLAVLKATFAASASQRKPAESSSPTVTKATAAAAAAAGSAPIKVVYPKMPPLPRFDAIEDRTAALVDPTSWPNIISLSYTRPIEMQDDHAMETVSHWVENGMTLHGGSHHLGFLFFYEMMTETLRVNILPTDDPHVLACLLLRFLSIEDVQTPSGLMSMLRVMAENPTMSKQAMPKYFDDRTIKIALVTESGNRAFSQLLKDGHKALYANHEQIKWPALAVKWKDAEWAQPESWSQESFADSTSYAQFHDFDQSCKKVFLRPFEAHNAQGENVGISKADVMSFGDIPLAPIGLTSYVKMRSRSERGQSELSPTVPFNVREHPWAKSHVANSTISRLEDDVNFYADQENRAMLADLVDLYPEDIANYAQADRATAGDNAIRKIGGLLQAFEKLRAQDKRYISRARAFVDYTSNGKNESDISDNSRKDWLLHKLAQHGGTQAMINMAFLLRLSSSNAWAETLRAVNKMLTDDDIETLRYITVGIMLATNRVGHICRCIEMAAEIQSLLHRLQSAVRSCDETLTSQLANELKFKSQLLAKLLCARRCYTEVSNDVHSVTGSSGVNFSFDPRLLVFEFTENLMLREKQYNLVVKFVNAVHRGKSLCHQMIMGAGKTTVVAPLLGVLLADGRQLLMQVVPGPLLEFSRGILRECFSSVTQKHVHTFSFDRQAIATEGMHDLLLSAKVTGGVVITSPSAIKSFMLKFTELMHNLDRFKSLQAESDHIVDTDESWYASMTRLLGIPPRKPKVFDANALRQLRSEANIMCRMFEMFREGVVTLDEVDLLLHPLKSELNWPLGQKKAIDLSRAGNTLGPRWKIPFALLDAIFFHDLGRTLTESAMDSREAVAILAQIRNVIDDGYASNLLHRTPHVVLLHRPIYNEKLRPLLCRWMLLYLRYSQIEDASDEEVMSYLTDGPASKNLERVREHCLDEHIKILNLCYDWLERVMPFVLTKIVRVGFGLLSKTDMQTTAMSGPVSLTRKFLAVPFIGKDVPSRTNEFANPDVVIGLTILAYRYEGFRESDFKKLLTILRDQLEQESGPHRLRHTSQVWAEWIRLAGGRVRGIAPRVGAPTLQRSDSQRANSPTARTTGEPVAEAAEGQADVLVIPALHLLDIRDPEQFAMLYGLLKLLPEAVRFYLEEFVFPVTMIFQNLRLTANGQDLGGEMLFKRRVGFSGTPSDLIPVELAPCNYERGDDAQMLHYLTDLAIVSTQLISTAWNAEVLLDMVANATEQYHVLIDSGALITGLSNLDVATCLLQRGLPHIDGVIFLDEADRKVILLRGTMKVVELSHSVLPKERIFTFFDQVHTTGMDIKVTPPPHKHTHHHHHRKYICGGIPQTGAAFCQTEPDE